MNTTDASTTATRDQSWTTAENNAVRSAQVLEDDARTRRAQAGLIANKPDLAEAHDELQRAATASDHDAEVRRGLARGYAAFRDFVRGA